MWPDESGVPLAMPPGFFFLGAPLISTRLQVKPVVTRIKPVSTGFLHTEAEAR
jgi:hypothetical protein